MKKTFTTSVLLLAWGAVLAQTPAPPNAKFWIYGQTIEERASSRLGYWRTNVNAGIGEVVVSYGRPPWKAQYSEQLDQLTRGKMWRMGDNYWTLLDTNLPLRVGGVPVAVGLYYLAVARSEDGSTWELVFIDPEKSREKGLDSFDVGTRPAEIPVLFKAPLTFEEAQEQAEKMTILLKLNGDSQTEGTLRLSWGNFALSTPVSVDLGSDG